MIFQDNFIFCAKADIDFIYILGGNMSPLKALSEDRY